MPNVEDDMNVTSHKLLCMDCANNLIMDGMSLVKRSEYERLKRLNDKLKKKIEDISEIILEIEEGDSLYNIFDDYYLEMRDQKRILKDIYNDKEI
jgi:hypothetical protein